MKVKHTHTECLYFHNINNNVRIDQFLFCNEKKILFAQSLCNQYRQNGKKCRTLIKHVKHNESIGNIGLPMFRL